jgi:flagellar export protein FliJ
VKAQRVVLQLAGLHRRLDVARAALAAAARDRRAVEVLKERRFARWKAEQEHRAATALDEIATARAARTRRPADEDDADSGAQLTMNEAIT